MRVVRLVCCLAVPAAAIGLSSHFHAGQAIGEPSGPEAAGTECTSGFKGSTAESRCDAAEAFVKQSPGAGLGEAASRHRDDLPTTETLAWDELSSDQKAGAKKLGYDKAKWNSLKSWHHLNELPGHKAWGQMSKQEQEGATALGWTKSSWDRDITDVPCAAINARAEKLMSLQKRCTTGDPCGSRLVVALPESVAKITDVKRRMGC